MIVVQQIRYRMSKEQKRRTGLAELYRAPETMRVPLEGLDLSDGTLLHHVLLLDNPDASAPEGRVLVTPMEKPLQIGCITITRMEEEQVQVAFVYTPLCGAPRREWANQTFLLAPGEWVQIRYNGRFAYAYTERWYYEKMVVNVALCREMREDLFVDNSPTDRFSLLSDLI